MSSQMTMNEYQAAARETAIYPVPILYPALGLAGESGEVCEKTKKWIRDDNNLDEMSDARKQEIIKELGDVLWYVANLAADLGVSLQDVAAGNIQKLRDRQLRGTLGGSGDNR